MSMASLRLEAEGLTWHVRRWGDPAAPALWLLHGFTGHGGFWEPFAPALAERFAIYAPDLPGHGATGRPRSPDGWSLERAGRALVALARACDPRPFDLLGYSLGGRLALHAALAAPEAVARLALVGAGTGLASPEARAERQSGDARWARLLREEGLAAFAAAWEAQPLFARQALASAERRAWIDGLRAAQDAEALAWSLEAFGLGTQADLAPALEGLAVPTRWIAGELDAKFRLAAEAQAAAMPHAAAHVVPGCGHNVPFEAPEAFSSLFDSCFPRAAAV